MYRAVYASQLDLVHAMRQQNIIRCPQVAEAMAKVDRANYAAINSYVDAPQPTGDGQTISAPHMHAHALDLLSVQLLVRQEQLSSAIFLSSTHPFISLAFNSNVNAARDLCVGCGLRLGIPDGRHGADE